jgi:hypothetical protein
VQAVQGQDLWRCLRQPEQDQAKARIRQPQAPLPRANPSKRLHERPQLAYAREGGRQEGQHRRLPDRRRVRGGRRLVPRPSTPFTQADRGARA